MTNSQNSTARYTKHAQRVNSKATLKVPLNALLHHVPAAIHGELRRSRYVAARSNTMIVQADDSRKQNENAQSCYKRLYEAIIEAGQYAVPTETSAEQVQRVKDLYVLAHTPDDPTADKLPAKSPITSAASGAKNSTVRKRAQGVVAAMSEAICGALPVAWALGLAVQGT